MSDAVPRLAATAARMDKIEHMGWVAGISFVAYGHRIGVRVNDPAILELLPEYLPYRWKPSPAQTVERLYSLFTSGRRKNPKFRQHHALFCGAECLARSLRLRDLLEALERDIRLFVAEHARHHIFVHAAVVGWNGRAIVIPGKSMSGKTSLAAEFVRAGAAYYSDEYAVFDEEGRVHPYAKPLSIRNTDGRSQTDCPVEVFGGRAGTRPICVGTVLATKYREGSQWRPRFVSQGMGVMSLLANAVGARNQPEKTIEVLGKALAQASVLKSVRGESIEVVESVIRSQKALRDCRLNARKVS